MTNLPDQHKITIRPSSVTLKVRHVDLEEDKSMFNVRDGLKI